MKTLKRLFCFAMIFYLVVANISAEGVESIGSAQEKGLSTDNATLIYDNNDGTYTVYLVSALSLYSDSQEEAQVQKASAYVDVTNEFDIIPGSISAYTTASEIEGSEVISFEQDSSQNRINWTLNIGLEGTEERELFPGFSQKIQPRNILKFTIRPKGDEYYGYVAAIRGGQIKFYPKTVNEGTIAYSNFYTTGLKFDEKPNRDYELWVNDIQEDVSGQTLDIASVMSLDFMRKDKDVMSLVKRYEKEDLELGKNLFMDHNSNYTYWYPINQETISNHGKSIWNNVLSENDIENVQVQMLFGHDDEPTEEYKDSKFLMNIDANSSDGRFFDRELELTLIQKDNETSQPDAEQEVLPPKEIPVVIEDKEEPIVDITNNEEPVETVSEPDIIQSKPEQEKLPSAIETAPVSPDSVASKVVDSTTLSNQIDLKVAAETLPQTGINDTSSLQLLIGMEFVLIGFACLLKLQCKKIAKNH